jgi:enoyl-CoA hydratase/carnithine racemase
MNLGINKILPREELMEYSRKQALKLIPPNAPSLSIRLMKRTIHSYFREIIENQLDIENKYWIQTLSSEDFKRSLEALKKKKDPNFMGN